jgi:hypothetical protein
LSEELYQKSEMISDATELAQEHTFCYDDEKMENQLLARNTKVRKLTRMGRGRSFGITLPIAMIRQLRWRERQKLTVRLANQKIIVEDWRPKQ